MAGLAFLVIFGTGIACCAGQPRLLDPVFPEAESGLFVWPG
jgi:hypothetical protein